MTSHPDLEHDLRALQALQGAPWVPEDYVLFRREVREAQGSVEAQLAEGTPGVDPSDERPLPTALPLGKDDVPWGRVDAGRPAGRDRRDHRPPRAGTTRIWRAYETP